MALNAFTSGNFYADGFNATITGTRTSVPLMLGKTQVITLKWRQKSAGTACLRAEFCS
jgi:hypothetical protein